MITARFGETWQLTFSTRGNFQISTADCQSRGGESASGFLDFCGGLEGRGRLDDLNGVKIIWNA